MKHLTGKFGSFAVAVFVTLGIAPTGASASSTFGVFARPLRVIYEPGPADSATAVRVQGMIAVPSTQADFGPPVCGYLYYTCKPGEEALCREQWKELAAAATAGQCAYFSARRDATGNLAKVPRVRPFDEVPSAPDVYGATSGLGVSTLGCGTDFTATCVLPEGGAGGKSGAAGAGGQAVGGAGGNAQGGNGGTSLGGATGQGGGGSAGPSVGGAGGVASSGGVVGAGGGGNGGSIATTGSGGISGSGGVGGASAGVDAAVDGPAANQKGGGCAVAGAVSARGALLGGSLLLLVLVARRRPRGGR